jgi:hypothetical protein
MGIHTRNRRLIYRNWFGDVVETPRLREYGGGTEVYPFGVTSLEALTDEMIARASMRHDKHDRTELIGAMVAQAVAKLDIEEQEFLARFYHMGETYRELSELTGRHMSSLERMHRRALRKLRRSLKEFVASEFGVNVAAERPCVICGSAYRVEIDTLIAEHPTDATWGGVMQAINRQFGIRVATPQTLIGHQKYH